MNQLSTKRPEPRTDRYATAIVHQDANVRVIAFTLLPGQEVPAHRSGSTVVVQVVTGEGVFRGGETEATLGPGGAAVFEPEETHAIRALDDGLHFLAILSPSPR